MTSYFVYENWTGRHARIHRGTCRYCNHGKGLRPQSAGQNGEWYGPFATKDQASKKLKEMNYRDTQDCAICMPSEIQRELYGAADGAAAPVEAPRLRMSRLVNPASPK